jgi:hypothetical protein
MIFFIADILVMKDKEIFAPLFVEERMKLLTL